jgi:ABC-type nickel/cobalt efflux system permease component RcnA
MPAMLASIKKIALVLLIATLPLQAFAAIVIPRCQQNMAAAHDHAHHDGHQHDRDAPAQDHDHPLTSNDLTSDHCGAGSVFAPPAASVGWASGSTVQRGSFTAAHCFRFIPEQPQRPPLA